jgi:hypothetical protein
LSGSSEEVRIRAQQQARIAVSERLTPSLHRAVELEELGVALEGFGEDGDSCLLPFATQGLRPGLRFRQQHGAVAVGRSHDALRFFRALRAHLPPHALALGLHAGEDGLGVLLRQIGAPDADVHHRDAEVLRVRFHPLADLAHDPGPFRREHGGQGLVGERAAERRGHARLQAGADAGLGGAHRLKKRSGSVMR